MKVSSSFWMKLFVIAVLCLGTNPSARAADVNITYDKLDVFSQVLHYVQNSYVEDVAPRNLIYGAIRGMLKNLDPHSSFMTPEQFKAMQEDTTGHFGGIGVEIMRRKNKLVVVAPFDDSPAYRAGILPGDVIVKIDGKSTRGMDTGEVARCIKGVPGTKVILTVDRDDFDKPKDFILIRQRIRINPIEKSLPLTGYGYIKIRSFQERTERFLMDALRILKKQSGGQLKGLILDLRNNPGGLLNQAIRVADRFIAQGVIVETKARNNQVEKDFAHKQGTEPDYPIVCLVNGGSASASEIVAGALQDHGRALVMGSRSFGKGSVQTVVPLKDGSGLKLTIARYYTPNHRSIQEHGIQPDVVVPRKEPLSAEDIEITREENLTGHLKNGSAKNSKSTTMQKIEQISDYQLRSALLYLKAWERFGEYRLSKNTPTSSK
jgi:carboxyl-terminal processing protease